MADLFLVVISLQDTVKDLQNSAQVLQDENADLRSRLDALESCLAEACLHRHRRWRPHPRCKLTSKPRVMDLPQHQSLLYLVTGQHRHIALIIVFVPHPHPHRRTLWNSPLLSGGGKPTPRGQGDETTILVASVTWRRQDNQPGVTPVLMAREKLTFILVGWMAATPTATFGHALPNVVSQLPLVTSASSPTMDTGSHSAWPFQPAW